MPESFTCLFLFISFFQKWGVGCFWWRFFSESWAGRCFSINSRGDFLFRLTIHNFSEEAIFRNGVKITPYRWMYCTIIPLSERFSERPHRMNVFIFKQVCSFRPDMHGHQCCFYMLTLINFYFLLRHNVLFKIICLKKKIKKFICIFQPCTNINN